MAAEAYLAFDLGAESGRAMLAVLKGDKLELSEVHRFANTPQRLPSGLHWNLTELWANLVEGLSKGVEAAKKKRVPLVSLGVDTWGVDFGLVSRSGQLVGVPFAYRDARNQPAMDYTLDQLGRRSVYATTGIQFMPFNSLYQLVAQHLAEPGLLPLVQHVLFMPDLLHYFFSGKAANEATIASTSQLIDPRKGRGVWACGLLEDLGITSKFLGKLVPAGTVLGTLRTEIVRDAGLPAEAAKIQVIVPGSHDTASAVAAVPVDAKKSGNWAYLSSGTWSLMGAELEKPLISDATCEAGFTNERGVGDKIRFLKNIAGLWLVQECRRDFAKRGKEFTYAELADLAAKSEPFRTLVDPGHGPFATPGDMPAKIAAFAKKTGQPAPTTPGQFVRCCLESLALTYRHTLDGLESLLGKKMDVLHIVGGGGQNKLLNQMTADAIDRVVVVGPYEATAIGNALAQAIGRKRVKNLDHLRHVVRKSFEPMTYKPTKAAAYTAQLARHKALLGK